MKEVEDVGNIHAVCRKRGIAHTTVHNWLRKQKLKGKVSNYSENRRLKKAGSRQRQPICDSITFEQA